MHNTLFVMVCTAIACAITACIGIRVAYHRGLKDADRRMRIERDEYRELYHTMLDRYDAMISAAMRGELDPDKKEDANAKGEAADN